jgi:hypothetical protein
VYGIGGGPLDRTSCYSSLHHDAAIGVGAHGAERFDMGYHRIGDEWRIER